MAPATIPPEVTELADQLLLAQRQVLGDQLLGLYLFGSATTGAFESGISDVDTVAVLVDEPSDTEIAALAVMHEHLARDRPDWADRVEVDYLSADAIAQFRSKSRPAARISPGEPFHRIQIDRRWITDWYQVLKNGIALYGPPPDEVFPPITTSELVDAVRAQLGDWPERISNASRPGQLAYAVLTLCRALRICSTGDSVSKKDAAVWARTEMPKFRRVIEDALAVRYPDAGMTRQSQPNRPDVLRLCQVVIERCTKR